MPKKSDTETIELDLLLEAIQHRCGYDFRQYARQSLLRRLGTQLAASGLTHIGEMIPRVLHDDQFLEDVPSDIGALRQALAAEDMAELRSLAHRLRGSADVLSATTLSKRAKALERASAERNVALVRQLAPALILELEKMLEAHR